MSAITADTDAADDWLARNDAYLGAALAALRYRFDSAARAAQAREAASQPPSPAAPPAPEQQPPARPGRFFRLPVVGAAALPMLAAAAPAIDTPADDIAQRLAAASEGEPAPALLQLARRLGLSNFERDVLLLCVALELDTSIATRCATAQGQLARDFPTFALAMNLFDEPAWEALSPERPLRFWRLVEISQPGARALTASALRADERIVNYVKGLNYLDDRLAPLMQPMAAPPSASLPPSQQAAAQALLAAAVAYGGEPDARTVLVLRGPDPDSKHEVAATAAAELGLRLYRLPLQALPADAAELATLARLWQRETLLLPLALYLDAHQMAPAGADSAAPRLATFVARSGGVVIVDTRDGAQLPVATGAVIDVARPTPGEQHGAWASAVAARAPGLPALLSAQFDLSRTALAAIAAAAPAQADGAELQQRLWNACREQTRPTLARLADRIDARATWDQLVLPATETALLRQVVAQVKSRAQVYDEWGFRARMNRGLGVSALFAGASGTGKTMAAEVLANDLQLDLYRIDLSAVVSKYIGETEKNLRAVFDAAEQGGAILLFDEADALFGKRSEVKDAHDRYANIETDYLLQRMEAFGGLAILSTNMKSALDPAFLRRLRFIVNFPYPGPAERRRIWERAFPPATPVEALDHERLARLQLTGGNIHSTALAAAFMAAHAGTPVTMRLLLDASRVEFRKFDRPVNEADFRWIEGAGVRP
ncbi:ATP-binding protein [Massilia aurea]|uniref:AAA family ATPase n=1 Tax=Massilia aurea TaxID=373040 RepID=UPI00346181D8